MSEEKSNKGLIIAIAIGLPLYIYASYVGMKYHKDTNQRCSDDADWLFAFGLIAATYSSLSIIVTRIPDKIGKICLNALQCFVFLVLVLAMGWSIYGIELFFKTPVCGQQELHRFGYILAWISVVSYSVIALACIFLVPFVLMTGGLNAFLETYVSSD